MITSADDFPLPFTAKERKKGGLPEYKLREWRADCRIFVRDVPRHEPDPWQDLFYAAVSGFDTGAETAQRMLALIACKGPGKSHALANAGMWWMFTRWHANGIALSITQNNLRDCLWSELARVRERSKLLQHYFDFTASRIMGKGYEDTWWLSARSFPQDADKATQDKTIAGVHGRHPFALCDESGDYPDGVVVAVEAILSTLVEGKPPDGRVMLAGNPTSTEGPLYRVLKKDRKRWWVHQITSDPMDPNRTPRVDKEWAQAQIDTWGRDSDYVKVNILGQFPSQQANKLIGPDLALEASQRKVPEGFEEDPLIYGLDVARYGDNASVLFKRQGNMTWRPLVWRELSLMSLADRIAEEYASDQPEAVFIDQAGVGGGVIDRLRQIGIPVLAIDFGGSPLDARFQDRRSEMYWKMADWLKKGGVIPDMADLRSELVAPGFAYKATGKVTRFKLESKDEMRKRGVASPDRADALALTFAAPIPSIRRSPRTLEGAMRFQEFHQTMHTGRIKGGTEPDWNPYGEGE